MIGSKGFAIEVLLAKKTWPIHMAYLMDVSDEDIVNWSEMNFFIN